MKQTNKILMGFMLMITMIGIASAEVVDIVDSEFNLTWLQFNGIDSYGILNNTIAPFGNNNSFTVCVETNDSSSGTNGMLVSNHVEGPWHGMKLYIPSANDEAYFSELVNETDGSTRSNEYSIDRTDLNHVCYVYDNDNKVQNLYVNDVLGDSDYISGYKDNFINPLTVGKYPASDAYFLNGSIYSIKIFNQSFNTDQIGALYETRINSNHKDSIRIPVLMYHSVRDTNLNYYAVNTTNFHNQMSYLQSQGFTSITFDHYYDYLNGIKYLPDKPIIISFDDQALDAYTNATPIMDSYGMIGNVGIVGDWVGQYGLYADWTQLNDLKNKGWQLGSHSLNHSNLLNMTELERRDQFLYNKELIYNETGIQASYFTFPYNAWNSTLLSECFEYYDVCTTSAYNYTKVQYNYADWISRTSGLVRIDIQNFTSLEQFELMVNPIQNKYVEFGYFNSTIQQDKSQSNRSLSLYNVDILNDGKYRFIRYSDSRNISLPYIYGNISSTITFLNATYDTTKKQLNITGTGTGSVELANLNTLKGSGGYYEVFHDGVFVEYSNTDTYTISEWSDWVLQSSSYNTNPWEDTRVKGLEERNVLSIMSIGLAAGLLAFVLLGATGFSMTFVVVITICAILLSIALGVIW